MYISFSNIKLVLCESFIQSNVFISRTPGTGLYDNLQQYRIPDPTAIFDITFFACNPRPFFALARELYPGRYAPNLVHYFVRLLQEKGILLRNYTQNIDGLERSKFLTFLPQLYNPKQSDYPHPLKKPGFKASLPQVIQVVKCWGPPFPSLTSPSPSKILLLFPSKQDCELAGLVGLGVS